MIRKILTYPNPKLNRVSKDIECFDIPLCILLDDMKETLDATDGVGLAAVQVGIPMNVLIIKYEDQYIEAINPVMTKSTGEKTSLEGCLSLPNVGGYVTRSESILVKYFDRNGIEQECFTNNKLATIWQHEMEHLKGGLYIDNLSKSKRKVLEAKYRKQK